MNNINVLDKSVYNLISAGEVVEKPASVVKELVENSIDAGATSISIEILGGGIDKIKVSDNGCGIKSSDMAKAFLPHATSKISAIEDLQKIGTLGFRGEALPSIATVSRTTMISKVPHEDIGYKIIISGGETILEQPSSSTNGTTVIVENLFFNTPARLKFLRKPKQEENEITNYISRLILANPNISFKYVADGKMVYQSFGDDLYNAIYCVYGKSINDNLIKLNIKNDIYELDGYIGKPTFSKPNITYQSLFVNGRYVLNQNISLAVFKAYENYIMKGTYPFFILNLKIDLDKVDVNVHPNKLDVKFENPSNIFNFIYSAILNAIINNNDAVTLHIKSDENTNKFIVDKSKLKILDSSVGTTYKTSDMQQNSAIVKNSLNLGDDSELNTNSYANQNNENQEIIREVLIEDNKSDNNKQSDYNDQDVLNEMLKLEKYFVDYDNEIKDFNKITFNSDNNFAYDIAEKNLQLKQQSFSDINETLTDKLSSKTKIIGSVFKTYILAENEDNLYILDQHAAHERILYDKFVELQKNADIKSQQLLLPYVLHVNIQEREFINSIVNDLRKIGFEIDEFGDLTFKIEAVPLFFDQLNLTLFFNDILNDVKNPQGNILNVERINKEYIAKTACKNAIKANMELSIDEIELLLKSFNQQTTLLCPHGRPIIIRVTKKEIEKWFKRII